MHSLRVSLGVVVVVISAALSLSAQTPGFQSANGNTTTSDKVGIGTTAPEASLHIATSSVLKPRGLVIQQTDSGTNSAMLSFRKSRGTFAAPTAVANGDSLGTIYSEAFDGSAWFRSGGNIKFIASGTVIAGSVPTDLAFYTGTEGQGIERIRISSSGVTTIGAAGGTGMKLTVNGDVNVTGNIAAKYQDVAEWVVSDTDLAPGTVVVLGRERVNTVTAAMEPFDTRVAGVVSEKPGLILGEAGASKEMVATTGRVRVRVDATRNAIAIGDLLVTSGKRGVAMKSIPLDFGGVPIHRPGTIIGKALEPLAGGEGEILVLLSLQ